MARWTCLAFICAASCGTRNTRAADTSAVAASAAPGSAAMTTQERVGYLDLASPTLVRPLGAEGAGARESKFVQVDIDSAVNPKLYPVTIRVDYAPPSGPQVHLSSFSLFPANHPGRFIVATQGKLRPEGAVVLTLERPEKASPSDTVRVAVRSIALLAR